MITRLACWIARDHVEALAFTCEVSSVGMTVQAPRDHVARLGEPGTRVRFRLPLPDGEAPLEGAAVVEPAGAAPAGASPRPASSIGLRVLEPAALQRLARFVATFRPTVLVVDEDEDHRQVYRSLEPAYQPIFAASGAEALELYARAPTQLLIASEQLPDMHCLEFFQRLAERNPRCGVCKIVVSEFTVAGQVKTLINDGRIFAYVRKPFDGPYLRQAVERGFDAHNLACEHEMLTEELVRANQKLARENAYLRQRLVGMAGFETIVGTSGELRRALEELARVRRTDATVHLLGETGTGKELVARALHLGGPRGKAPFVVQNLAGVSDGLLQSALFGHRKGAFTGADRDYAGLFQQADGGTLFFDDVANLSPVAQASVLRALQEGEFTPLGASAPVSVEVRFVSAAQKNLRGQVAQGRFREDLYFRLAVIVVELPPLRSRTGDIPLLATHFLDRHCELKRKDVRGFSREAMAALERHSWPGNVRELENEVERLVVFAEEGRKIVLEMLSPLFLESGKPAAAQAPPAEAADGFYIASRQSFDDSVGELERAMVGRAFREAGGSVTQAAKLLGIERSRASKLRDRLGT